MANTLFMSFLYIAPIIAIVISGSGSVDFLPVVFSILIVLISVYGILKKNTIPFSLFKIFNLFNYMFLGIIPIITYVHGIDFWDAGPFTSSDYLITNAVVLVSIIIFNFVYKFARCERGNDSLSNVAELAVYKSSNKVGVILVLISLLIFVFVYYVNGFDVVNVFTRGKLGDRANIVEQGQIHYLFFGFFLIPILSINLLLYGMTNNPTKIIFIILAFLLFFAAPPTSMPRFAAAAMYIPLMLLYLNIFRQKNIFSISLIFGLLFIFPLLEVFRYQISDISNYSFSTMIISSITGGHFDSYQSLMVIIKDGTVTYGLQLAGALLFFFPREFWNDKPIGSGQFMAERLNFSFDNVSANYLSEGFINFGYFGILIFVTVLAVLCGRLDRVFKKGKLVGSPLRVAGYLILLPLLFFTLRGDLMSSFSFLTGFMLAVFVIDKIIKSV